MSWKDVALMMESRAERLQDDNTELVKQVSKLRCVLLDIKHRWEVTDFCMDTAIDKALEETC